jgi:CBS domain-containing protein
MVHYRMIAALVAASVISAAPVAAGEMVPFRGTWTGQTDSATFIAPDIVLVVASGGGEGTHLGRFTMVSPHYTYLATFAIEGTQVFTAANGDTITATISGTLAPQPDGTLEGTLAGVITGGTGRFAGATGAYDFHIVATPIPTGFASVATIDGTISSVGSTH